jgi:hypothetical protein
MPFPDTRRLARAPFASACAFCLGMAAFMQPLTVASKADCERQSACQESPADLPHGEEPDLPSPTPMASTSVATTTASKSSSILEQTFLRRAQQSLLFFSKE